MSASDTKRELLLLLLAEMQVRQPRVGYYLIYYLKLGGWCSFHLLLILGLQFKELLVDDTGFLHMVISSLDPCQVNRLVCEIIRGQLDMFPQDDLSHILKCTLDWASFEQIFFWQLMNAHELPTKKFISLMLIVDFQRHPEACAQLLLLLQLEKSVTLFPVHSLFLFHTGRQWSCSRHCSLARSVEHHAIKCLTTISLPPPCTFGRPPSNSI
ncbi:Integrator complex subunit 3 [Cichlidogyrus casuarinus]|uniref:Integrator complex subunit 3 n=1 Tax=Cichlidogyrus casuarinus TaxID=1844966 RepID=A0ABD2PNS7_9PLAT